MKNRRWLAGLVLVAALQACNFSPDTPTPLPVKPTTGSPTELVTQPPVIFTPSPFTTDLPTIAPTYTPGVVSASPTEELVNCRFGPGTLYEIIGELRENQTTRVVGKNSQGTWWYINDPGNPDGFCWVAANVTRVDGDTNALPIIPPPVPSVTNINISVDPNRIVVACNQFPQTVYYSAEITTNGPALVTYRWEASTGVSSVDNAIAFEESGTQTIRDYYQIGSANDYWIKLHVLGPNTLSKQANFIVICN